MSNKNPRNATIYSNEPLGFLEKLTLKSNDKIRQLGLLLFFSFDILLVIIAGLAIHTIFLK